MALFKKKKEEPVNPYYNKSNLKPIAPENTNLGSQTPNDGNANSQQAPVNLCSLIIGFADKHFCFKFPAKKEL